MGLPPMTALLPYCCPFPAANAHQPATSSNPRNDSGGGDGVAIFATAINLPCVGHSYLPGGRECGAATISFRLLLPPCLPAPLRPWGRRQDHRPTNQVPQERGPPTGYEAIEGDQAAAYVTIFSSKIQPTSQPNNFSVSMTDFLVTIRQICKHLQKRL